MAELKPSRELEVALKTCFEVFGRSDYWLGFGGLWGLICNDGVIPDGDLDICVLYPYPVQKVIREFKSQGYLCSKVLQNDMFREQALYAGFNRKGFPHICVSFWYAHEGVRYFCHDTNFEMHGPGVPPSGYFFKGVPAWAVEDESAFHMVDWPGIRGSVQVRVPVWPGVLLDHMYPLWGFRKQRFVPKNYNDRKPSRTFSYHKGGAISPYRVHVKSMKDWGNRAAIRAQIEKNRQDYMGRLQNLRVRG